MRARSLAVVAAAVVVAAAAGVGGGYAAGRLDDPTAPPAPQPSALDSAAPVPAAPELPIAKDVPYAPDIDYPELAVGLSYVKETVRGAGHTWRLLVPQGWKKYPAGPQDPAGTLRWRPEGEPTTGGFLLRILPLLPRDTPAEARDLRKEKFQKTYRDVHVIRLESDSAWFAYRTGDNYRRFNYFAWVTMPDTPYAGFELSVAGRERDQDGLADLLETVKRSVRMVR